MFSFEFLSACLYRSAVAARVAKATEPSKPRRAKPSTVEQASEHVPVGQRVTQHSGFTAVVDMIY